MKKKNAFTLIELLATVAIIAVVSLAATVTYNKIRKDILEHQYLNLKTLIETAAIKYSSQNGYTSFFVQDLIDAGLVEPDDEKNVYDPRNDDILNCHVLFITEEQNGTYSASLSDKDYTSDGKCNASGLDQYEANLGITKRIEGTNVEYSSSTTNAPYIYNGWTKYNLDLTAVPTGNEIHGAKYVWNKNTDNTTVEPTRTHTTHEYGVYNDYYYLDMFTASGVKYTAKFVYKFDNEKPTIYKNSIKCITPGCETDWKRSKTVLLRTTDKNGSGIARIYVGYHECEEMLTNSSLGVAPVPGIVQIYEVKENTGEPVKNLNVCVLDKAGNLAKDKFEFKLIDPTPPVCADVVPLIADGDWTKNTRTIRVYCSDTQEEVYNGETINVTGIGCEQDYYDTTYENTTTRGSVVIRDKLGNERTCSYNVLVDKTNPYCPKPADEPTEWSRGPVTLTQTCADDHSGCATGPQTMTFTTTMERASIPVSDNVTNSYVCTPKVLIDLDAPTSGGTCGGTYTVSSCPGGIPFHWNDPHSGFAGGEVSIYYKAPGASDYTTIVQGLGTDADPVPGFWYRPSSDPDYQYYTCAAGEYKFELVGRDSVGNQSDVKTCVYTVGADPDPDVNVPCTNCTPRTTINNHGSGTCISFHSVEQNPQFCTANGYDYMPIYEDTGRCPGYGCKSTGTSSSITYSVTKNSITQATKSQITTHLPWNEGNHQYDYMMHSGSSGSKYYFFNCSGYSGTSMPSWSSLCTTSSTPYRYVENECHVTKNTKQGTYTISCTYNKTACTQYNNGEEYLRASGTSFTYACLEN